MAKIHVAGARGLIGSHVAELSKPLCPPMWEFPETEVFINCIGYTDVDGCETNARRSANSNVETVLWQTSPYLSYPKCKYVHLSTDFLFDGEDGPYSESATPRPLSVYGAQKWVAESIVRELPNHLIVRTTCVYGWHAKKQTFAHWVRRMCAEGKPFQVTEQQWTTPTYVKDLARIILRLVEKDARGIVNVTCGMPTSRYMFARDLAQAFGFDPNLVEPTGAIYQAAKRPRYGGLKVDKLMWEYGIVPQPYRESLEDMAETWAS